MTNMFHYSRAETVSALLPDASVIVLQNVGHLPMMESPMKSVNLVHIFIDSLDK